MTQPTGAGEATDFLYPFIDAQERDPQSLRADAARSASRDWGSRSCASMKG